MILLNGWTYLIIYPTRRNGKNRNNDQRIPETTGFASNAALSAITFGDRSLSDGVGYWWSTGVF